MQINMSICQFFCISKLGPIGSMLKFNHGTNKKQLLWFYSEFTAKKVPLFSCKRPQLSNPCGWVALHFGRKKAILHHFICSSHANKSVSEWNKTGSGHLLLPATLPTHGAFWADGKRITTTPLCLLVSLMAGAGEHHSPKCLALAKC